MRTAVVILRGPHRGRTGTVAGALGRQNPLITRVPVIFADGRIAVVRLSAMALRDSAQLPLPLGHVQRPSMTSKADVARVLKFAG